MTEHKQRVLSGQQLRQATGTIAAAFVLSGALGVVRQGVIGARFGAGSELDAFYAAYRIPEMLFTLVAGGALGSAFIPVFGRFLSNDDADGAWRLASAVITLVTLTATALAALAALFGPWITSTLLIPEASPAQQALTTRLMQIMLSTVIIFGISGLVMGILNANQHFLTPALAPSMNNLGLILGALFLTARFGVYGLVIGAVLGALLHVGIQLPALLRIGPRLRPIVSLDTPGVREVLRLMGPRVVGSGVVQVNFLVNTALASGMAAGSFTALTVAFSLMFTVLGILGQSVGTAVFPSLVVLGAREDLTGFRQTLAGAMRGVLFMSLPAFVGMVVLARPLVAVIYEHGLWTPNDTIATAWAFQLYALGLAAFALQEVLARAFYALHDTATPVAIAVGGMILNVALSLSLIRVVQQPYGGLAISNVLATTAESAVLWLVLRGRLRGLEDRTLFSMIARTLAASLAMGAVVLAVSGWLEGRSWLFILIVGVAVGGLFFEGLAFALGLPEARDMPMSVLRRFRKRPA